MSTPPTEAAAGVSLSRRLLSPQTAISIAALAAVVVLIVVRFDIAWSDTWRTITALDPWWFLAALAVHYCTFLFRGARWRLLLRNVARRYGGPVPSVLYAARVVLLSWFANSVTWFRIGDAYRAYVYAEDSKTSFSRSMGTVLADRLVDLTVVILLMAVGVGVLLIGGQIRPPLLLMALAGGLLAAIAGVLAAMGLAQRWVVPRLPQRVAGVYRRFHEGTMDSFGSAPALLALGVAAWMCEVGRLFFVLMAIGAPIALGLVLFVPMANGLLTAAPLTPGGLGIVETGITGLLRLELAVETAVAVALVDRTISYASTIVSGGLLFAARQISIARGTRQPRRLT